MDKNVSAKILNKETMQLSIEKIREDFPLLSMRVYGKPLVYFDNAATTQKPKCVIETLEQYYSSENSNVHRGVHYLSELATKKYEDTRKKVQKFINASSEKEIVFVRGATEAINLVASTFGKQYVHKGDEVLITGLEHHSNIVPWQMLCEEKSAKLVVAPIDKDGNINLEAYSKLITKNVKIIAITHVSNSLGTINPVKEMIRMAHEHNVPVLVDGAQAVSHFKINVQELDADFYVFSSHKMYGPTGVGILYGKENLLEAMPPYQGGGDMIKSVTIEKTIYNDPPYKFEAGTPNVAGVIGLGSAIDYLNSLDWQKIQEHEKMLSDYLTQKLSQIEGLRIIGNTRNKVSVVSFLLNDIHPHDVGTILDREGIAVRTGHHCAQPVMDYFGVPATVRASLTFYNTIEEIDVLVKAIQKVKEIFNNA